jgi:hypothetical protein
MKHILDDDLPVFGLSGDITDPAERYAFWESIAVHNSTQYQRNRQAEYPPLIDYIDGVVKGDQAQIDAYIAACQAVKAKYPKPESV